MMIIKCTHISDCHIRIERVWISGVNAGGILQQMKIVLSGIYKKRICLNIPDPFPTVCNIGIGDSQVASIGKIYFLVIIVPND